MKNKPIVVIESGQMWRRKIDHKALVVMSTECKSIYFYEYNNPRITGWRNSSQWMEQCYLMGVDDILAETGGIF